MKGGLANPGRLGYGITGTDIIIKGEKKMGTPVAGMEIYIKLCE